MLEFLSVSLFIILAVLSPGPDFALTVRNTIGYSTRIGIFSALGIATSTLFHTTYTVIGLTVLISQSAILFQVIKYFGAGYLIYLGIKGLVSKKTIEEENKQISLPIMSAWKAFRQGFLCNALNPKTMLFFLALFTLVINSEILWWFKVIYGVEIAVFHFLWFAFLAMVVGHPTVRTKLRRLQLVITRIMGGLLVFFGSNLAIFG